MTGRVIAITGAFGVLGSAVSKLAEEQGYNLALIDASGQTPAHCPDTALVLGCVDLTDPIQTGTAVDAVLTRFERLDALVNVAGRFKWETVEDGACETWHDLYRLNVLTAANASRAAIPHLKRSSSGRIVNVGSAAALRASAGMGPYAASKSGVHALTQALAEELKKDGVTVNAVLPSIIDTAANRADMPKADFSTWVAPRDLASVILYLASEEARAVTGALLPVHGRV